MTHAQRSPKPNPAIRGRSLIEDWRRSGLSQCAYARKHQVGLHLLTYWSKRLKAPPTDPVKSQALDPGTTTTDFVQVPIPDSSTSPAHISATTPSLDIRLACGAQIRVAAGVDPALLRLVVKTLEGHGC